MMYFQSIIFTTVMFLFFEIIGSFQTRWWPVADHSTIESRKCGLLFSNSYTSIEISEWQYMYIKSLICYKHCIHSPDVCLTCIRNMNYDNFDAACMSKGVGIPGDGHVYHRQTPRHETWDTHHPLYWHLIVATTICLLDKWAVHILLQCLVLTHWPLWVSLVSTNILTHNTCHLINIS